MYRKNTSEGGNMKRLTTVGLLLLLAAPAAFAQTIAPSPDVLWHRLHQLPPGSQLLIEQTDGDWMRARLVAPNEETLTLQRGRNLLDLPRTDISKVWLFGEKKTGEGAAIGSVLGALFGAVSMGLACGRDGGGVCALLGGAIFGGAGAGLGAAVGAGLRDKILVYDSGPRDPSRVTTAAGPTQLSSPRLFDDPCTAQTSFGPDLRLLCRPVSAETALEQSAQSWRRSNRFNDPSQWWMPPGQNPAGKD